MTAQSKLRDKTKTPLTLIATTIMAVLVSVAFTAEHAAAAPQVLTQNIDFSFELIPQGGSTTSASTGSRSVNYNLFDSSLGNLGSVTFAVSAQVEGGLPIVLTDPGVPSTANYQMNFNPFGFTSGLRGPNVQHNQDVQASGVLPETPVLAAISAINDSLFLSGFIGPGQRGLDFRTHVFNTGPSIFSSIPVGIDVTGLLSVTYFYDGVPPPPVSPLPISGAAFLLMVGLTGLGAMRRQA